MRMYILLLVSSIFSLIEANNDFSCIPQSKNEYACSYTIEADSKNPVYHDSIVIKSPQELTISPLTFSVQPADHYDTQYGQTKKKYSEPVTISFRVKTDTVPFDLDLLYHAKNSSVNKRFSYMVPEDDIPANIKRTHQPLIKRDRSLSTLLSSLLTHTNQLWVQLLACLLLGLLFSLTPCIFPMIPITMGILQSQSSNTFKKNFLMASCYAVGMAMMFALLGLFASYTGALFGTLAQKPIVKIGMILFIGYMAGAMMGLYELYMPSGLSSSSYNHKGSYSSAFLFGALSGTVASPCLSPGLLVLLTLVSGLSNAFHGFALLFMFGIGVSTPLLLIGFWSSSLHMMPRAGMWMVEIKRMLGVMMFGVCLYFMQSLLSPTVFYLVCIASLLSCGIYFMQLARKSMPGKQFQSLSGIVLCACALFLGMRFPFMSTTQEETEIWMDDYPAALTLAKQEHKPVFLEVSGSSCSICKVIDRSIIQKDPVQDSLNNYVKVKIIDLDTSNEIHKHIQQKYQIVGVPAYLIINPENEVVISRWSSELYDVTPVVFAKQLDVYAC